MDDFFKCPLCGEPLSMNLSRDSRGKFHIEFFCEGAGDDSFSFEIATGLSNSSIAKLKLGEYTKEMTVELLERKRQR